MEFRRVKFTTKTRGLDVIQTVYGFAISLGITSVFIESKTFLTTALFAPAFRGDPRLLTMWLLLLNVLMLGLRFMWVPRNLSGLIFLAARQSVAEGFYSGNAKISNTEVALHLLTIFLHGMLFFLVCGEFEYIAFLASSSAPLNAASFTGYIVLHISLLILNAGWISLIKFREQNLTQQSSTVAEEGPSAGSIWWQNNLVCGLLAMAPFAAFGSCDEEFTKCASASQIHSIITAGYMPFSPEQIDGLFYNAVNIIQTLGVTLYQPALTFTLIVLLSNSFIDLLSTGHWYLFFEDVEWEEVVESERGPI